MQLGGMVTHFLEPALLEETVHAGHTGTCVCILQLEDADR